MKHDVQHAEGLAHIDENKEHTHDDRWYGEKLAENGYPAELLVIVEIIGQDDHDGRGRHADKERELGDVESPGHVPAHPCDAETFIELPHVIQQPEPDDDEQEADQTPVSLVSGKRFFDHGCLLL